MSQLKNITNLQAILESVNSLPDSSSGSDSPEVLSKLNEIHGSETAASTVSDALINVETGTNRTGELISNIKERLDKGIGGANTEDATAESKDILEGTTAYIALGKVRGSMPNNGNTSFSLNPMIEETLSVPKGYYDGTGKISIPSSFKESLNEIKGGTAVSTIGNAVNEISSNIDIEANLISRIKTIILNKDFA